MKEEQIVKELEERGIVRRNSHYVYTSGKHGRDYIDKNTLLADTDLAGRLAHELAMRIVDDESRPWPQVVVGPAMSGAILAHLVAQDFGRVSHLIGDGPIYAAYAEKSSENGLYVLRRNYDKIVRGRTVLVVEDVVNSGGSALGTAHAVMEAGGIVIAVGVYWNRGETDKIVLKRGGRTLEMPITSLVHKPYPSLTEEQCKAYGPCYEGVPINPDLGYGANYLELDKPRC